MGGKAYQYIALQQGGPLELKEAKKHVPADNEILVKLKAVGLNPIDWKQLYFGAFVQTWPVLFGHEGSGVVEAVGKSVTHFKAGDDVLASFGSGQERTAAFQTYAAIDASRVAKKPSSISFEDAAALPVGYLTASAGIYQALKIPLPYLKDGRAEGFQPSSILVCGGSGTVGGTAIQLLRLALPNAQIFATASKRHHENVKKLGADQVFDHSSSSLVDDIKKATPGGNGVEAILDCVNGVAVNTSLFDVLTGPKEFAELVTGTNVEKVPAGIRHTPIFNAAVYREPGGSNLFAALEELLNQGKFQVPVQVKVAGQGLESISAGLEKLKAGVSGTKLVVTI